MSTAACTYEIYLCPQIRYIFANHVYHLLLAKFKPLVSIYFLYNILSAWTKWRDFVQDYVFSVSILTCSEIIHTYGKYNTKWSVRLRHDKSRFLCNYKVINDNFKSLFINTLFLMLFLRHLAISAPCYFYMTIRGRSHFDF